MLLFPPKSGHFGKDLGILGSLKSGPQKGPIISNFRVLAGGQFFFRGHKSFIIVEWRMILPALLSTGFTIKGDIIMILKMGFVTQLFSPTVKIVHLIPLKTKSIFLGKIRPFYPLKKKGQRAPLWLLEGQMLIRCLEVEISSGLFGSGLFPPTVVKIGERWSPCKRPMIFSGEKKGAYHFTP